VGSPLIVVRAPWAAQLIGVRRGVSGSGVLLPPLLSMAAFLCLHQPGDLWRQRRRRTAQAPLWRLGRLWLKFFDAFLMKRPLMMIMIM